MRARATGDTSFLARDDPRVPALWAVLEERAEPGLTCSWAWTETWLRHYGDVVPHSFLLVGSGAEPVALALVTRSARRVAGVPLVRRVHLGTAGEPAGESVHVECNRLLALPGARPEAAAAIVRALRALHGWDELSLDGFDPQDAAALTAAGGFEVREQPCPTTDLAAIRGQGATVLEALSGGVRRRVERALRGLGELETEWAGTPAHGREIYDELVALHQARWRAAGEPGAFASARFRGFHGELIERLTAGGEAILFRVRGDAGTIACLYALVDRGRVLFYQGGVAQLADNKLRPGLVGHVLLMQACLERGLAEYDFLAGEARYKRELSTTERPLTWATARRRGVRSAALGVARALRRRPTRRR
jgi:CelD/BcsL family acetyltransferase involved in cellulose biosynthesis